VRALYLEKNRIAASKCRNRQKRQEEKLVEKASIVERLNKDLKCEVELLKESMRHLMGDVGRHTNCSDNRLATYVQRRADRLAVDDVQVPFKMEQDMDCDQGWQSTEEK
jgi:cyclic AMP-dependent transcription factor ATF-2